MNFIVIPAQLLPLNRPCNCTLLCLKEERVWERSNKQSLFPFCFLFAPEGINLEPLFAVVLGPGELEITHIQRNILHLGLSDQEFGI